MSDNSIRQVAGILGIEYRDGLTITKRQIQELHEKMYEFEKEFLGEEASESFEEYIDSLTP